MDGLRDGFGPDGGEFGMGMDGQDGFTAEDFFQFFSDSSARHGFSGYGYEQPGSESDRAPPPPKPKRGGRTEDGHVEFPVTLEELYKGKVVKFTSKRNKLCELCSGSGGKPKAKARKCAKCEGSGSVKKQYSLAPGIVSSRYIECNSCKGRGELFREKDRCKNCKGSGLVEGTKILEAYIPRGAPNGYRVVLDGEADEEFGKKTGAVVIEAREQPHAVFDRKNNEDLYATIRVSLAEAIGGFSRVVLEHLDGRGIRVSTPPGTVVRPNEVIKIPGEGMPIPRADRSGDLYLYVDIEFPPNGWCIENNDLRKLRDMLPNAPTLSTTTSINGGSTDLSKIPESQVDDVDYRIIKKEALPEYPEDHNNNNSNGHNHPGSTAKSDDGSSVPQHSQTESCTTQ